MFSVQILSSFLDVFAGVLVKRLCHMWEPFQEFHGLGSLDKSEVFDCLPIHKPAYRKFNIFKKMGLLDEVWTFASSFVLGCAGIDPNAEAPGTLPSFCSRSTGMLAEPPQNAKQLCSHLATCPTRLCFCCLRIDVGQLRERERERRMNIKWKKVLNSGLLRKMVSLTE